MNAEPLTDLVVLAPRSRSARCRVLGTDQQLTLRCGRAWTLVPGEIVTVQVAHERRSGRGRYVTGEVLGRRLDVSELGLTPLLLRDEWPWDPAEHYWGEPEDPLDEWEREIIARGVRPSFEMEQVIPGEDPEDWDADPIIEANDLWAAGEERAAERLLGDMLIADPRCLDAHAHLGNFSFERSPEKALRHYEVGVRIGELTLGRTFEGVLPWGRIDNRPYLRCLHGFGLCLWRLGRREEAAGVFERMLWLNPSDNQGIRLLLPSVRAGEEWEDE